MEPDTIEPASPVRARPVRREQVLMIALTLSALALPACEKPGEHGEGEHHHKIVLTTPQVKDVVLTQQYVAQIRSRQHIKVQALSGGYLQAIKINEGQEVKKGDPMFKIVPTLYKAKLDAEVAEANLAQQERNNTAKLVQDGVLSDKELSLYDAKLAKANAKVKLAEAELKFTDIEAPFTGLVDRQEAQLGSLIKEGEVLTTLSDNSTMWVYFNVPEVRYLEYMASKGEENESRVIELRLANGNKFPHPGAIGAIESKFNSETGNIPFRADFPNPENLLRHGQVGSVLIHRTAKNAMLIPQKATFEILDRRYVFVVDKDNTVHQREVVVENELEDVFVLKSGLETSERFVLEGVRQVRDGQKLEDLETRPVEQVMAEQKHKSE